jgi:N-acetylglucosaminyldiphosphoundecaprenol N-acetyl-beta-D-mannosaminyltransferase
MQASNVGSAITESDIKQEGTENWDDLSRNVYCVLGIPIDAINMAAVLYTVDSAIAARKAFFISTPNLNFLVNSQKNQEFRESLLASELCPADGMPFLWIARLLGLPIEERVAGSDLLGALRARSAKPIKLFLFGGVEGAAAAACKALNQIPSGAQCVGWTNPGFGTVEEMSADGILMNINASGADFLLAALGAVKGQQWLLRNHDRLLVPVRAHLGATINFATGKIKRAPSIFRKLGLEWLWRIKEEPYLWRRYCCDGATLLRLLVTHVFPLALKNRWDRLWEGRQRELGIERKREGNTVILSLSGAATTRNIAKASFAFREAVALRKDISVNLSRTCFIDARFLGLLLMLRKRAKSVGSNLSFTGVPRRLKTTFRLNGVGFLLGANKS